MAAVEEYYHSHHPCYENVMVEATYSSDSSKHFWFASIRLMLRISWIYMKTHIGSSLNPVADVRKGIITSGNSAWKENSFVQSYEMIHHIELTVENVDDFLGCHRLKWGRDCTLIDSSLCEKSYGSCPIDSSRGKIHLVHMWKTTNALPKSNTREQYMKDNVGELKGWKSKLYYVNRFIYTGVKHSR